MKGVVKFRYEYDDGSGKPVIKEGTWDGTGRPPLELLNFANQGQKQGDPNRRSAGRPGDNYGPGGPQNENPYTDWGNEFNNDYSPVGGNRAPPGYGPQTLGVNNQRKWQREVSPSPTVIKRENMNKVENKKDDLETHIKDLFFDTVEHSACKETYEEVIARLKLIKEDYYDAEFPPEWSSLWGYGDQDGTSDVTLWRRFTWRRCKDIFKGGKFSIFPDTIKPSSIAQGYLGDCYFISTLAAIAENPDRIKRIISTKKKSSQKCYCVQLCVTGIWEDIILDDFIPFYEPEGRPAFTRGVSNDIWVLLLEKAWAKVHRGYLNINSGLARECLRDITGAPTKTYFLDHPRIWEYIETGMNNGFIMTAGSSRDAGRDILSSIGLVGSHAYSLLGCLEVFVEGLGKSRLATEEDDKRDKRYRRLVKLRNPWGRGEWKGDWSDNSHLWSEKLRKKVSLKKKDDGVFFMDFVDFKKYFSDMQICYYHDDYKYSSHLFEGNHKSDEFYVRIRIPTPGMYYISLNQTSKRMFPKSAGYEYSPLTLVLAQVTPTGEFLHIDGIQKSEREVFVRCACSNPGEYMAYIRANWKTNIDKFSISAYGPDQVVLEHVSPRAYLNGLSLNSIYKDRARKWAKPYKDFSEYGEPKIKYFFDETKDGFGYFYFVNDSDDDTGLLASVILKKMQNVELVAPYKGKRADITVPAHHDDIILYRILEKPASLNYVVAPRFRKSRRVLKRLAKERGKKSDRPDKNGDNVGIKVYLYRTQDGLVSLYVNQSEDYALSEQVEYQLEGCSIVGSPDSTQIDIKLMPGDEKMIHIVRNDDASFFRIKMKDTQYVIIRADES